MLVFNFDIELKYERVSAVKPDNDMPLVLNPQTGKEERVEVVMNPYSTINRKSFAISKSFINAGKVFAKLNQQYIYSKFL